MAKIIVTTDEGQELEWINVSVETVHSPLGKEAIWFGIEEAVNVAEAMDKANQES